MIRTNESIATKFQQDKEQIALLRREGLSWHLVLPVQLHQTLFPALLQQHNHFEEG